MLVAIALIEMFRLVSVVSNVHAMLAARDPVPVAPEPGTRVAFITTCVPGKEPIEMVRETLAAALQIRHGVLDVWLLDEGDDPEIQELCAWLGAHHFTRKGVPSGTSPRARSGRGPSTATTTAGWTRTATSTTSSCRSTPTTCRCPTSWSACSATSATRSGLRGGPPGLRQLRQPGSPRPPRASSSCSTR